jgi:putative hemolysin
MKLKLAISLLAVLFIMLATGCQPVLPETAPAQLANPASVHCGEQGGTLDIRTDADGGQVGYCQFDDGSECEEWAFFRGDCQPGEFPASTQLANPASVYCGEQGGTLEIREDDDGGQYGVCIFADGSECEEWAFFREECKAGGQ